MRSTTALAAGLTLGAAAAGADTFHWTGTAEDGFWANPENWQDAMGDPIEGDAPGLDGMPAGIVLGEAATGTIGLEAGRATLSALELTDNSGTALTDGTLAFSLPEGASGTAARLTVAGSGDFMGESLAFDLEDDLLVEASVDTGLAGNVSGTGALRLRAAGDSEITLSGRNSQTGGTVIEAGTVAATGGEALSEAGAVTLAGGIDGRAASVLRIEQDETVGGLASAEGARGGLELAGGSLTVSGGPASSFGLGISGSGGLAVGDGADLTLAAANSYEGGTVVSGGALSVTAGGSLGSGDVSVADGSLLTYGAALGADQTVTLGDGGLWTLAGDETVGGLDGTGTADLGGNRLDIALPGTETLAFAGSLKGGTDSLLALTGGGEYMLTGSLSDYRGGFRIEAGRLGLSDAGGALNDNALTLAGGTLVADLENAFGGTIATEAGSTSTITAAAGTTLSLTGGMALAGDLSFTAEGEDAEIGLKMASVTLQEGVSLGFDRARFKIGSEAAAGMFAADGGTRLGAEAVLDLAGHDVGIAALTGSGRILTDSGDAVLGLGDGTDFGGVLADGAAGRLSLETDGTVRLTGDNSLTGGTSVTGGSLTLAGGGTLGDIEIASAGRFVLEDGSAGSVVNSGTGSSNAGTIAALTQKAGSFANSGTVSGATSVEGGDLSNTGTLSDDVSVSGGSLSSSGSIGGKLDLSEGEARIDGSVSGAVDVSGGSLDAGKGSALKSGLGVSGGSAETAGTVLGGVSVTGGRYDNSGNVSGGLDLADGSVGNTGTIGGAVTVGGGTLTNGGTLSDDVSVSGGSLSSSGSIGGTLDVSEGEARIDGSVTGAVDVSGGSLEAGRDSALKGGLGVSGGSAETAGTVSGGVSVTGGRYDNSGSVSGGLDLADGTVGNTGTIGGEVTVGGGTLTNGGTLSGDVSVSGGSLSSSGSIGGDLDVTGGTATNSGWVGGKSSVGSGGVLVSEGGRFGDDLTIQGDTGSGAGTLRLSGTTTVAGDVTNDGNIETAGGKDTALNLTDGGGFTNNGSITVEDGSLTVAADTITISDGASMKGDIDFVGAVVNKGELDLENDLRDTLRTDEDGVTRIVASLDGAGNDVENAGRLELGEDLSFTGVGEVSNSGTVEIGANGRLQAERIGNAGRLNLGAGAALEGTGNTLENTGTITVGDGGSVTDAGAIENRETGLIEFTGGGTLASDSDASGDEPIRNAGRIVTTDDGDDTITLGGANPNLLENLASGSLEIGDSDSVIGSATTLDNAGSVTIGTGSTLELAALATAAGGSLTNNGMLKAGSVTSAGSLTNNAGAEIASDVTSSGSLSNAGTISGDLSVTGGTATNSGSLQDVSVSGGALTVTAGSLTGLSVSGGSASLEGGSLSGDLEVSGGAADVDVAVGGTADVTGGRLTIGADGSVAELTTVGSAGSLDTAGTLASLTSAGQVENSGTITGDVAASGGTFLSSGTVSGDVAATGGALASVSGRIDGALTAGSGSEARVTGDLALGGGLGIDAGGKFDLRSGTVTMAEDTDAVNDGTAIIGDGTLKGGTGGSFRNRDGGQLSVTGTGRLETDLVNADGAGAEIDGTIAGAVENDGEIALGGTIDGALGNDGTVRVAADDTAGITGAIAGLGSYLVEGRLDFGGSFDLGREGETEGRLALGENATVSGDLVTSYGTVTLADGSRLEADLVSSGQLTASGSATVDGDLTLSDGAVLSLSDGTADDRLDVTGDARLNGTIGMDIDLTDGAQSADAIHIDGVASGNVLLAFNDLTTGDYGQIRDRLDLLSYGSDGGLSVRSSGLPTSGSILYRLDRNAGGDGWGLISGANPALGGLSSGLALTQSLIGSVVNRPTSPYVSGLASTEGSPCGWGSWGRAMGGKATASGNSHTALGSFSTEIDASYGGVQAGLDYSCFDGGEDGWNLSFGTIFGLNDGSIKQPVYLFDPNTGTVNQGIQTSRNHTDFQQLYGGAYIGASRGRFFADLQVTVNETEFDLENKAAAGAYGERLGVDDQSYDSTGHTVSGTVGYAFPLGEESGFSLIPSLGFSVSRTKSDDLYFSNDPGDDADDGVLKFDPINNEVGFASVTLSRSRVLPSGVSVLNGFATATAYHDFSDRSVAKYYELDSSGAPLGAPLVSENDGLGNYGELSAGFNYTRILGKGQAGAARQMDASVRVDSRFGDDLDGWGVTAQMRFQF
ncbi:autotransporter-associated beta strand protein [Rhodovulum sulfidophilum]|nr:autotransporter-associated beta strand protein [Rhodovulum sulfidophilum]